MMFLNFTDGKPEWLADTFLLKLSANPIAPSGAATEDLPGGGSIKELE